MKSYRVAIMGATGLVGQELIKVLEQRSFPLSSVRLFASDHTAGKKLFFHHQELTVEEPGPDSFRGMELVFFCGGADVSRYFAPLAVRAGATVIDSSATFNMETPVPLVVPEVNPEDVEGHKGIIASPSPATIPLVLVLNPLHRVNPVRKVTLATYQSVSENGAPALEELTEQTKQVLEGQNIIPHVYPHQIAFNLLPEVDVFLDNGYTREEWRLFQESQKIMHAGDLLVSATCVRVPLFTGHSMALHVELSRPMSLDEVRQVLVHAPGVKIQDDPTISLYPQPWAAIGTDEVYVGRIRQDASHSSGLVLWAVTDNLRKGAALNSVQLAEELIKREQI
ncbi:MAG: aspartate-semialdehyde dehydrogenase [Chloroflexota bacterium]